MRPVFRLAAVIAIASASAAGVSAQAQRMLSIDAIYDPDQRVDFSGAPATNLRWIDADTYLERRRTATGAEWLKVDAASGRTTPLFDIAHMTSALSALPGVIRDEASDVARGTGITFNPQWTAALVTLGDDLYVYAFGGSAVRLTRAAGPEDEPTFSPDGRRVAFVRSHNLYAVDVTGQKEIALTTDGSAETLNGKLDWLYQEEIYGRGNFRGFWWSPDSARLAFLQLDERPVPEYTVVDDISYRPIVEVTDYPKAGDPNPKVRLAVVNATGGSAVWAQLDSYVTVDFLIVDVDWTPDSRSMAFQVQDREQTWLELNLGDAASGRVTRVLRETTKAWVNANGSPNWLKDGSFLWFSERDGFKHLYHYRVDGTQLRQVTSGRWDVRRLAGIDEQRALVYFESGARRHIDTDIYRIGLDGQSLTRLSRTDGTHRASFNPAFTQYVGVWSHVSTPAQVRLHRADGTETRVLEANRVTTIGEYAIGTPEFLEVRTRDGFVMDAMMIKPPDFDPARKYPVYQYTYAGPGTSLVRNQWGGSTFMYHQLLAQQGVIVWILDNRSAGGKGVESQWPVYGRLGELELQDLEDGITWLKQQPYVDAARIVLHGWSYGGFMTAYALTNSTSWSAGIIGAPVSDWRNYDSIYTERYMKTPQNNPDGYTRTAPRFAAARLHGRMLLIHGSIDDNVHRQNSEQLAYELQRAGKPFEMMVYPKSRHAVTDARLNKHLRQVMFDFIMRAVR